MDWLTLLKTKVEDLGRRQVEADLGVSKATLSLVLNEKYVGNLDNMEKRVLNAYANLVVECPVLGEIPSQRCQAEQGKPFSHSNPQRVRLFRACQVCSHRNDHK